jgi:hypothetical protein
MVKTWALYLTGFLWPIRLDILPAILLESHWINPRTLSALTFLLLLIFFLFWQRKKIGLAGVGLWWFFVFLLPVANLVPIKAFMAWRFVYISWIGLILTACFVFSKIPIFRFSKIILGCWTLALCLLTLKASSPFTNSETLWKPMIEKYPKLAKPYRELAYFYLRENRVMEAQTVITEGIQALPQDEYLFSDYAKTWILRHNYPKALEYLQKVSPQTRKELGESFVFDWVFTCYQLEHFQEIVQTLSWMEPEELPVKTLLLQAQGAVLAGANAKAKSLYDNLLTRDLDPKARKDCITIYRLLEQRGNTKGSEELSR